MQPYLCNMTIVFPQESVDICRFSSASTSAPMASSLAHTHRVCHSVWVCNEVAAAVLEYKWKLTQRSTEKHENDSWGWWWADCQCCTLLQSTVQSEEIQILVISSLLTRIALSLSQDSCCSVLDVFFKLLSKWEAEIWSLILHKSSLVCLFVFTCQHPMTCEMWPGWMFRITY